MRSERPVVTGSSKIRVCPGPLHGGQGLIGRWHPYGPAIRSLSGASTGSAATDPPDRDHWRPQIPQRGFPLDLTGSAAGELVFHLFGALAQFERQLIRERTKAGLQAAKRRGRKLGRRASLTSAQVEHARQLIAEGNSQRDVARLFRVSHTSVQRALERGNAGWAGDQ
jgi:hypothetical protein